MTNPDTAAGLDLAWFEREATDLERSRFSVQIQAGHLMKRLIARIEELEQKYEARGTRLAEVEANRSEQAVEILSQDRCLTMFASECSS